MHLPLLLLSLIPAALAAPVEKRSATSIVNAINTIESRIATLNNTLNPFEPRQITAIATVLAVQLETDALGDAINAATKATTASAPLSEDDSNTVAQAVLLLEPQIASLITNIISKKPAFDTAVLGIGSVAPQVEQDLKEQNTASTALGNAITAKLTPDFAALAPLVLGEISAAFQSGIQAYAVPGGVFSLPPLPSFEAFKEALENARAPF